MLLHFQRVPVRGLPVGNKCGSRSRAGYVTIITPMVMNVGNRSRPGYVTIVTPMVVNLVLGNRSRPGISYNGNRHGFVMQSCLGFLPLTYCS